MAAFQPSGSPTVRATTLSFQVFLYLLLDDSLQLLFDVGRDAGERDDLAARHPDRVQKLKAQLEAWEKDVDADAAKVNQVR